MSTGGTMNMAPSVADIIAALRQLHKNSSVREMWAFFDELRIGTGFGPNSEQRIDAFAIALWPSKHWVSHAYEVKVNRADVQRELKGPLKRRAALRYSNLFWFATPEGLIRLEELPVECGLIEMRPNLSDGGWLAHVVVHAPWRDVPPPTWNLFASVARRVQRLEDGRSPTDRKATG